MGGPAGGLAGGIAGGAYGYETGKKAWEQLGKAIPASVKEATGFSPEQRELERKKYSTASDVGGIMPDIAAAAPLYSPLKKALGSGSDYISNLVGKASRLPKAALSSKPENLAESLRTKISGTVKDVISGAETKSQQAAGKESAAAKAQREIGGRGPVAEARQLARTKEVSNALNNLGKPNVLEEDVGAVIQPFGKTNVKGLTESRQLEAIEKIKDPAFEKARAAEAKGESISSNPKSKPIFESAINDLEQQISRTVDPYQGPLKERLQSFLGKERPMNEGEQRVEQLRASVDPSYKAKTTVRQPMTLDEAEFMRRMLTDKNLAESSGFAALDVARKNEIANKLSAAMKEFEPGVGEYLVKYKETSAPIEKALAGQGKSLTKSKTLPEEEVLFSADKAAAANYYLDGTKERADRLLSLVGGKKPELMEVLKGHFRNKMEQMDSKAAQKLVQDNEGFLRTFGELRKPMEDVIAAKKIAETAGKKATEKAGQDITRVAGEASQARVAKEAQDAVIHKYGQKLQEISKNVLPPKESYTVLKNIAADLRKNKLIDPQKYSEFLQEVRIIQDAYGEKDAARTAIAGAARRILVYGGLGITGTGAYYGSRALLKE